MMQAVIKETKESSQSDSVDELRDSECSDSDLSASTVKSNDNDSTYIEEEPNTNSSSSDESFDSVPAKELKNLQIIKPDKEKRERKKPARFGLSNLSAESDIYPCGDQLITYEEALNGQESKEWFHARIRESPETGTS
ncbi:hypothetical protein ACJJTC_000340 [Scirpophaga incertulas]